MAHIAREEHLMNSSRRAADWSGANPILMKGELGQEVDTGLFKLGDGLKKWNELAYAADPVGSSPAVDTKLKAHMADMVKHTTQAEKDKWNSKAEGNHNHDTRYDPLGAAAAVVDKLESHKADFIAHTTQAEKEKWNGKAEGNHNHDTKYDPLGAAAAVVDKLERHKADSIAHTTLADRDKWNSKAEGNHNHDTRYDPLGAAETAAADKMDKAPGAMNGNIAVFDGAGNVRDYGAAPESLERIDKELADLRGQVESKAGLDSPGLVGAPTVNGKEIVTVKQLERISLNPYLTEKYAGVNGPSYMTRSSEGMIYLNLYLSSGDADVESGDILMVLPDGYGACSPMAGPAVMTTSTGGINGFGTITYSSGRKVYFSAPNVPAGTKAIYGQFCYLANK